MRRKRADVANIRSRTQSGRRTAVAALLLVCTVAGADASSPQNRLDRRSQDRLDEMRRREGEALLTLADAAMAGRAPSDFAIAWSNDFFKAQTGTFVPFTVTIDRSALTAADALMYVRAARRDALPARGGSVVRYPFDIIFPVALHGPPGQPLRITRGFAVAPGDYDVYVALRERAADPLASDRRLKGAVLKQPLTVPDFWTGELATSTIMLADRIDQVATAITGDEVLERPYVIGANEVHRAAGTAFRRDRELIVVFLIYNPAVSPDKRFEIEVDYHLFRKDGDAAQTAAVGGDADHPPARDGERYVTRTTPQRFKPAVMGADFDPASGPIMAGQGILLSSFQEGEYRLGITVTDLMSRKSLSRDVTFKVVGS
jgi:hypothetical protein